jgi:hypothetical protein
MVEQWHYPAVYPKWVGPRPGGKPTREDQSRNGVRVIVYRNENGSTVDAACQCFGSRRRLHSNPHCPLIEREATSDS